MPKRWRLAPSANTTCFEAISLRNMYDNTKVCFCNVLKIGITCTVFKKRNVNKHSTKTWIG